ncbi:WD domain, G-beta repeat [Seminavis robusta]|uniref:WD domain, G-beta repeat n=1 Tax=Seminavis robusta TaxID=568900 RepID=A0A9N8DR89_9STRA|nr:WD domain, G-beta repeat [Seminavis robusta]|eukprot:Sro294_g110200.1 WD domain, G-beta repeat (437) ;mRNA; r:27656-28966
MPIPLKPPSRTDPLNFPVFGMSWYGNAGNGLSLLAYCGGGGSARTGVNNAILVKEPDGNTKRIDTGDNVGVALKIVQNPVSGNIFLMVALGKTVERYNLPSCEKSGEIEVGGDGVNAINVNIMTNRLACGCENGEIKVYEISDERFDAESLLFVCQGHTNTICSVDFSCRGDRIVSSAKDGTARVWQGEDQIALLKCEVHGGSDEKKKKKPVPKGRKPPQILVRGCAFGELEGRVVFTVASTRRGSAFLGRWVETPEGWECERVEVSDVPISAMSISSDGFLLALGSVSGSIILWGVENWRPIKTFKEVHDLPVTCIAARPYDVPLMSDEDGLRFHAISASADSRLGHLSLQPPPPKPARPGSFGDWLKFFWNLGIKLFVLYLAIGNPLWQDTQERCSHTWARGIQLGKLEQVYECVLHEVLIAPESLPGVMVAPY